ncbi:MAG TPA: SIS domain-containing protein [Anaerolineales bacterium]|nr:SIS domain-containing protein [Anaerolineales bacterium]
MNDELIPQEIHESPEAIRATVEETRPEAAAAADAMRKRKPGRIFLIGNGTSLYSSMAASYTGRALAKAEDAFVTAWPAGDFRYFMPELHSSDVVVGMSASGEFRDVLAVFQELRGRVLCVGVTHIPGSSITRLADHVLFSRGGPSRMPVMTKTYESTLTAVHLLLLEFFGADASYYEDLAASAGRCEKAVAAAEACLPSIVPMLSKMEHGFYFGAGCAYASALEAALKMKEMAILHSEGSETWEMASGPATRVSSDTFCVGLETGGATDQDTVSGLRHAKQWGAPTLEVAPRSSLGGWYFPVEAARYQSFSSLALVPPLALLAYRVARARGATPDEPQWRDRYASQGMTHILG